MLNILYVTWWEGVHHNGLLRSQVYTMLKEIVATPDIRMTLLSAGPFWRGALLRHLANVFPHSVSIGRRAKRYVHPGSLKEELAPAGIEYVARNTLLSPGHIYLPAWMLLLFPWCHLFFLRQLIKRRGIDIVHCRSYAATWVVYLCRLVFRQRYSIVFDSRGLLPQEGVACGMLDPERLSYALWMKVEKRLVLKSDLVVVVSDTFAQNWRAKYGHFNIRTVYLCANIETLNSSVHALQFNGKTLAFLGSISKVGWHSPEYLARLYKLFRLRFKSEGTRLLLVTAGDHQQIRQMVEAEGVAAGEIFIESAQSAEEVGSLLQTATYGCLPLRCIRDEYDQAIACTMLSTKFVEYVALGLPVLCNYHITGVVSILEKDRIGYAVNLDEGQDSSYDMWLDPDQDQAIRMRCRQVASRHSHVKIGRDYVDLYTSLRKSP